MKKIFTLALILFAISTTQAQQEALFSQYMFNNFILNPAIAGSSGEWVTTFSFRRQWMGIKDAPVTQTLGIHGMSGDNIGVGGFLYNDVIGPSRRTGIQGAFSYHIPLSEGSHLAMGVSGSVFQFKINTDKLTTENPNDEVIAAAGEAVMVPDASAGFYYYDENLYAGFSVPHLFETKVKISQQVDRVELSQLTRHYYGYAGYKIEVSQDQFYIDPSVLIKYVAAAPVEVDVNARFIYSDNDAGWEGWLGSSYRTGDAVAVMLGAQIKDQWDFGYAYDITLSRLSNYSICSHEVILGYRFGGQ